MTMDIRVGKTMNLMYLWAVKPMKTIRPLWRALATLLYLITFFCLFPAAIQSQVVINEIMADNQNTVADEAGDFVDWVELYNSGDVSVNLFGYGLTDTPTNATKFLFNKNVLLDPHSYLVVWFDSGTGANVHNDGRGPDGAFQGPGVGIHADAVGDHLPEAEGAVHVAPR